jgi:peptide/nickel transport system ATP-binding protein
MRPGAPILEVRNLTVVYPSAAGPILTAAEGIDLDIGPGEIHALVGESGAGKTTVGNAIMGLLEPPGRIAAGSIWIAGHEVDPSTGRAEAIVPGREIGAIFQDPMTSLNPLFTVESQLTETIRFHLGLNRVRARDRALSLLQAVGIPEPERRLRAYPHQLSGGQRQRVVIAAALSCDPKLLVADEPTTALDVSIQAQILDLIRRFARERELAVLLVTHNMGVVAEIADRVTVMHRGRAVETGSTAEVLRAPRHDYAKSLIGAVPPIDRRLVRFPVVGQEIGRAAEARAQLRAHSQMRGAKSASGAPDMPLLQVDELVVDYRSGGLLPGARKRSFRAVDNVSFTVREGEIFGLVGESGCGKTTVANAIAGLIKPTAGRIRFAGLEVGPAKKRASRGALQMIFQDPYSSLNGRMRVDSALAEPILFYGLAKTRTEAAASVARLLEAVGLDAESGARFPFSFSGGQRQRISIARALAAEPILLVCDEPTSSLDVSVQAQILNLLKDLRDMARLTMLFISHDLTVVRQMCDRVAVMQSGRIVELADCDSLFANPQHAYTRQLLSLVPSIDRIGMRSRDPN